MAVIRSLRILPPFAIARLGSGERPMDNYTIAPADEARPLDYRRLVPRETFLLDKNNRGEVKIAEAKMPEGPPRFKEIDADGKVHIRPVAPFLEAFVEIKGSTKLRPLTKDLLHECGYSLADVSWRVHVANRKVARRTGDERDVVSATAELTDHRWAPLDGRCENFRDPKKNSIAFGRVVFLKPTKKHPEIRMRFEPGKGLIYGPVNDSAEAAKATDPHLQRLVIPDDRSLYKNPDDAAPYAGWQGMNVQELKRFYNETLPPSLFAINPPAPNWLFDNVAVSRGYLDDACDGFVELRLGQGEGALVAIARICAAPPATAPDALFVRSLADDLDQAILGPAIDPDEDAEVTRARALDIVRRAFETVSFMNVAVMNGNAVNGRPALILDSMPEEEAADTQRALRPVMAATSVDTFAIKLLHQQAYAALQGGAAPWFTRLLRRPDQVADFTDVGRRKMPALMCGADNNYLALTWRQIATIEKAAAAGPAKTAPEPLALEAAAPLAPRNLTAQIRYAAAGNPINTLPVTAVANCCPGLEVDFRAIWRRLFKGIELREYDNLVVRLWPEPGEAAPASDWEPQEPFEDRLSVDEKHKLSDLQGHRLLRVRIPQVDGEFLQVPVIGTLKGPASSDMEGMIDLTTSANPAGVAPLEWSNALALVMRYARLCEGAPVVRCDFSVGQSYEQQVAPIDKDNPDFISFEFEVRPFFEDDSAVISRALARAGELTQGLCSPWQNDFRECSCYYWASARPDFVNVETDGTGLSVGDNWMQRERTGVYVADDYKDARLMMYDELFRDWESRLKFVIGGRDVADPLPPRKP